MGRTLWLVRKELVSARRSRWLILAILLGPLLAWGFQALVQGFMFRSMAAGGLTVYYTDEDEGPLGADMVQQMVLNNSTLQLGELVEISMSVGTSMVEEGNMTVWVIFPGNFTSSLESERRTTITVYVDSGSMQATGTANRVEFFIKELIDIYEQELIIEEMPVRVVANFGLLLVTFLVPILSVTAPAGFVSSSFAGERENRTLEALLALPMSRFSILLGKLYSGVALIGVYGIANCLGLVVYNELIRQLASGFFESNPARVQEFIIDLSLIPLIIVSILLLSLCSLAIGIVVSCLAKDQRTAMSLNQWILMIPTMIVGLFSFTGGLRGLGGALGLVVRAIPFTHAILFMDGVLLYNAPLIDLAINIAYLLGSTVIFLVIGAKIFQREAIID